MSLKLLLKIDVRAGEVTLWLNACLVYGMSGLGLRKNTGTGTQIDPHTQILNKPIYDRFCPINQFQENNYIETYNFSKLES